MSTVRYLENEKSAIDLHSFRLFRIHLNCTDFTSLKLEDTSIVASTTLYTGSTQARIFVSHQLIHRY